MLQKSILALLFVLSTSTASAAARSCLALFRAFNDDISISSKKMSEAFAHYETKPGVTVENLIEVDGVPIQKIHIASPNPNAKKVFLSGGVHGNEPLGVAALLRLMNEITTDTRWSERYDFTIIPLINPRGIDTYNREYVGNDGVEVNLNRTFVDGQWHFITAAIRDGLRNDTFDYAIDLHGSIYHHGFFMIKAHKDDQSLTALSMSHLSMLQGDGPKVYVNPVKPDRLYTFEEPGLAHSDNPGTLKGWLHEAKGAKISYTLEYPRDMDPNQATGITVHLVEQLLHHFRLLDFPDLVPGPIPGDTAP